MGAIHIKKIKGNEYAYNVTSYWDKERKKVRKKTVYMGRVIDKEKGIYEKKSDRMRESEIEEHFYRSMILNFGDTFCLSEFLKSNP